LDVLAARSDFPILSRVFDDGKPLIYLDNAATSQKPQQVIEAISDYYSTYNSNVHRAVHRLAGEATAAFEDARTNVAKWFGTVDRECVIFTTGTTEAINLAAHSWGRNNLVAGDVILLTEMEHHSNIVPWQMLRQELGVELRYVPVDTETFRLDMQAFDAALEGVKLVCSIHTSNVLGIRNPIEHIIEKAHAVGARVLLDCAQAAAHNRLNVSALGADMLTVSSHKMCGPTGIGALLIQPDMQAEMRPFMGGGDMIKEVYPDHSIYQDNVHRFEAGTPRIAQAIGWSAAIDWLSQWEMESVAKHIRDLARHTACGLAEIPGIKVYGDHSGDDCSGAVSFLHESIHAEDIAHMLDARGIAVRTGHHCAQPLMRAFGIIATNRASFYLYNTKEEADAFLDAMRHVVQRFSE
jgi:cysteine desulfurase/selenocysteine lyase